MKKLLAICTLCIIFLSSCEVEINNSQIKESDKTRSNSSGGVINNSHYAFFPVNTYGVYEIFNDNSANNEFDEVLLNNPIDKQMNQEMETTDISSTREAQIFFDGYVKEWQDELEFSINNLKVYLTSEEIENLENAQKAWENNLELSRKFDRELIQNRRISLGTQYVSSALIYMINQHRERVFHIKYMTMLAEEYIDTPVQKSEQLWNRFHEPN